MASPSLRQSFHKGRIAVLTAAAGSVMYAENLENTSKVLLKSRAFFYAVEMVGNDELDNVQIGMIKTKNAGAYA